MKNISQIILLLFCCIGLNAQNKTISGKIIDEHFQPLQNAIIQTLDSNYITRSDNDGFYKMTIPESTKKIKIQYVAMETDSFNVKGKCEINIILLDDLIVEFETEKQHKKRLRKRKRQLSNLYKKAIRKGIIELDKPCG
jgi:CarboxypepD_reg-like domain